ncbi:MAG: DUF86 domain-containing protein [Pseudomonadota bacterium]|nr:DUF86 domain-containing protein [Pseudomonadota bacterium]
MRYLGQTHRSAPTRQLNLDRALEAIDKVEHYVAGMSFEDFIADDKTVDAVVRNFEIIGEAARQIPKTFKETSPDIPWRDIADFRNVLIHEYFGVDLHTLWQIIEMNLGELKNQLRDLGTA